MTASNAPDLDLALSKLAGVVRLIDELSRRKAHDFSPTPYKRGAESIADQIHDLIQTLEENGTVQFDIECEHDRDPPCDTGEDGWPIRRDRWTPSYQGLIVGLRDLESSARRVVESYPAPQKKSLVPFAAMALLHLRRLHDHPAPTFYDRSEAVQELVAVMELAGMHKDAATCRKYLKDAYDSFDVHYLPIHLRWIVLGKH